MPKLLLGSTAHLKARIEELEKNEKKLGESLKIAISMIEDNNLRSSAGFGFIHKECKAYQERAKEK